MTAKLEFAIGFALRAHSGQEDMLGLPAFLHPLQVLTNLPPTATKDQRIAAVLHDVVEDTDYTVRDITELFGDEVGFLVDALTHRIADGETYPEFIQRIIAAGPEARMLKRADVYTNLNRPYDPDHHEKIKLLRRRYRQALLDLEETE